MTNAPIDVSHPIVGPAVAGEEPAILDAFVRAFEGVGPRSARPDLEEWRWRTLRRPSGPRSIVARNANGEVLAHFGGWRQRVKAGSESFWTSQAIDSFVVPEVRRGLWRARLFEALVATYVEHYCGSGPERDRLAWGLPVERAWRLGRARAGYRRMDALWWLVAETPPRCEPRARDVEARPVEAVPEGIGARWARAYGPLLGLERDHAWLVWRYECRPGVRYRLDAAWRGSEIAGLCAWRCGTVEEIEGALLCTWLVAPGDEEAARALLASVAAAARAAGAPRIAALVSPHASEFALFQDAGFRVRPARHFLAGRAFGERRSLRSPTPSLDLQLGDTDLA